MAPIAQFGATEVVITVDAVADPNGGHGCGLVLVEKGKLV